MIYADYNATTPCLPEVAAAVGAALTDTFANPGSRQYAAGRAAQALVDQARQDVADLLHVRPDEVIFTSGATEACQMAIFGVASRLLPTRPRFTALAVEHPAVRAPLDRLARHGGDIVTLPVLADGRIDLDAATTAITEQTALVCAMLVNNETGVIHDVAALADLAHAHGALVFCDATQTPARWACDLPALGADFAAFSAHKLYGPKGVGALWLRRGLSIDPPFVGGGQERGLRPGTLNVPGIAGFGVAARVARERLAARIAHFTTLTERLEATLRQAIPDLRIHGAQRVPGVTMLTIPGLRPGLLTHMATIAVSAGSSCSSGTGEPSHVLSAMGVERAEANNAIRISLGESTSVADVDEICAQVIRGAQRLR